MIHRRSRFHPSTLALPLLLLAPSCAAVSALFPSSSDDQAGFVQVDDLLSRIERVHVDCELGGLNVSEGVASLMVLVGPEFRGDPELAYNDFANAILASEKQAKSLRQNYGPLQASAEKIFDQWNADLEAFNSEMMREHSEKRMVAARDRYNAIVAAVDPLLIAYEDFNQSLRDHALYLGNDFNAESVALIEKELRSLSERSASLRTQFNQATAACQDFVRKAALRGQISPTTRKNI